MVYSLEFILVAALSMFLVADVIYYAYMWKSTLKKEINQALEVGYLKIPLLSKSYKKNMFGVIKLIFLDAAMIVAVTSDLSKIYIFIIFCLLFIFAVWSIYDIYMYISNKKRTNTSSIK